jgi:MFS transporter, ACS family, glucarate transporter
MGTRRTEPSFLKPTRVRFGVLGFACSLSLLTYLDRICIMRVKPDIQRDLGLSDVQVGLVFSAFLLGYALFEVPSGWMGDVWGSRRVLTRIVLWWSLFTALTGAVWPFTLDSGHRLTIAGLDLPILVNGFLLLLLVRFLFGVGEAGAYPNLTRVVSAWFPYRERGMAQGAIWMSARLGGAIAPFVIGRLTVALGWRPAFWILGLVGVVWCLAFIAWFRNSPEEKPSCNAAERELIRAGSYGWKSEDAASHAWPPWRKLVGSVTLWALCVVAACVSFGWYFYPTWQPQYLEQVHGISYEHSEILTGLPFLCGAAGSLLGGRLSDWLVHVTGSRRWGRSLMGVVGFTGAGLCVLATGFTVRPGQAVTLLCLAFFINDLAIPAIWASCQDVGGRFAGTVAGIMNMAGGVGAILSPALTPVILRMLPSYGAAGGALGLGVSATRSTGAWPPEFSQTERWRIIFAGLALAWFVGAVAWLFVNAARPLFDEPTDRRPPKEA